MKRVIAFLLALTVPLGLIIGAHKAVDALEDDVTVEFETIAGDPARADGMEVELLTTCGNHMYWITRYTPGQPGEAETQFFFTQNYHDMHEYGWSGGEVSFYAVSGMGMSTSGGGGFYLGDTPLGILASAVAERTAPAETRTETLTLSDYVDVYPMEYWAHIYTDRYILEESQDTISTVEGVDMENESYDMWTELFRFPVVEGSTMEVSVGKDYDGSIVDLSFNLIDGPEARFVTAIRGGGMFFAPIFHGYDGAPIETGQFPEGYGVYYIPLTYTEYVDPELLEDGEVCDARWDFEALRLVYPLEPSDDVAAMELSGDGRILHLILREGQTFRYCAMDTHNGRVLRETDILTALEGVLSCQYVILKEEDLLYLTCENRVALVDISGECNVEFVIELPGELYNLPLPESIVYRDGVLYCTALDWNSRGRGFVIAVMDKNGLGYCGHYYASLHREDRGYGSGYVSLDRVAFAE